eukprot:2196962-Pleurochrysis_carterae.AAC.1
MSCATCAGVQSDIQPRDRYVRAAPAGLQPPLGAHVARRGGVCAADLSLYQQVCRRAEGLHAGECLGDDRQRPCRRAVPQVARPGDRPRDCPPTAANAFVF